MDIVKTKELPDHIQKGFKRLGIRKQSAFVHPGHTGIGDTVMTGWSEGSRDQYSIIGASGEVSPAPMHLDPNRNNDPWGQRQRIGEIAKGSTLVAHGTFRGKPSTPAVWATV